MAAITIRVPAQVRDLLKEQAARAHRTLAEHVAHLAELEERRERFWSMQAAIATTSDEVMAAYRAEALAWE
jgi:hypothetical protein